MLINIIPTPEHVKNIKVILNGLVLSSQSEDVAHYFIGIIIIDVEMKLLKLVYCIIYPDFDA